MVQYDSSILLFFNNASQQYQISLDIPLANEVLTLLLLGSVLDSWETLVVMLGTTTQQKDLTLDMLKSSLLHEEAQRN